MNGNTEYVIGGPADDGVRKAIELGIPANTMMIEIGAGSSRNAIALALAYPHRIVIAYDLNTELQWIAYSEAVKAKAGVLFRREDPLELLLEEDGPCTFGFMAFALAGYYPKEIIREILPKLWRRVAPGGFFHFEASTMKDELQTHEWTLYNFVQIPDNPGSFITPPNWFTQVLNPELGLGISFWEPIEIQKMLGSLEKATLVHTSIFSLNQEIPSWNEEETETLARELVQVTFQKEA